MTVAPRFLAAVLLFTGCATQTGTGEDGAPRTSLLVAREVLGQDRLEARSQVVIDGGDAPFAVAWSLDGAPFVDGATTRIDVVPRGVHTIRVRVRDDDGDETFDEHTFESFGDVYFVDTASAMADDANPGTESLPWRTLSRAGRARELEPGDTVLVRAGVYREPFVIDVSGTDEHPITFAAARGAKVVIKGSELVTTPWERVEGRPNVWKTTLDERLMTALAARPATSPFVSQVIVDDVHPLRLIGDDPRYSAAQLPRIGRGVDDLFLDTFFFDAATHTLFVCMLGPPSWRAIEIGVRGTLLEMSGAYADGACTRRVENVTVRGFSLRHNNQPIAQWPAGHVSCARRVVVESLTVQLADFAGFAMSYCEQCTLRDSELSLNGDSGLGLQYNLDTRITHNVIVHNNYRLFSPTWHAGGIKAIPGNRRVTVEDNEIAYNDKSAGVWFDTENEDIRIVHNVIHHNGYDGVFYEINQTGGATIADNLVFANGTRGIYVSGSRGVWIVNNTVAENDGGIVCMPREDGYAVDDAHVMNNVLIHNCRATRSICRGADVVLWMGVYDAYDRTNTTSHSDYNVFANTSWEPNLGNEWNLVSTLAMWRERYGEDVHSTAMPLTFVAGEGFVLEPSDALPSAGAVPVDLPWKSSEPRVGSVITRWPTEL